MVKTPVRFCTLILILFTSTLFGQQKNLWSRMTESGIRKSDLQGDRNVSNYSTYALDLESLKNELKTAPKKESLVHKSYKKLVFPDSKGRMVTYLVKEAPVMDAELARKYPNNKSYLGVSEKDGSKRIRFSINEFGFNAIIRDIDQSVQYIEPLTKDKKKYKLFYRNQLNKTNQFECLTENQQAVFKASQALKLTDDGKLRTYRLALAATGEYSQFHIAEQNAENKTDEEKKAIVLSAMTTAITQVNAIYENDLAIALSLVGDNDTLIYLDPDTDPYTNLNGNVLLQENQNNCDAVIGSE